MKLRLLFFFLFTKIIFSQQLVRFEEIGVDEGLPSDLVYQISEDTSGYIWIATDNGVVKYNGTKFSIFQTKQGLPSNDIFGIKADSKNRKWITGYFNGAYFIEDDKVKLLNNNKNIVNPNFSFEKKDTLFFNTLHVNYWYTLSETNILKKYSKPVNYDVRHIKFKDNHYKYIINNKNDTIRKIKVKDNIITVYKDLEIDYDLGKKLSSISMDFSEITQIFADSKGNLWIIDGNNRLFLIRNYNSFYLRLSVGEIFNNKKILFNQALIYGDQICFLTNKNALYSYNLKSNRLQLIKNFKNEIRLKLIKNENLLIVCTVNKFFKYNINSNNIISTKSENHYLEFTDIDFKSKNIYYNNSTTVKRFNFGQIQVINKEKYKNRRLKNIKILKNNIIVHNEFSLFNLDLNLNLIGELKLKENISLINGFEDVFIVGTYSEGILVLDSKLNVIQKIPLNSNVKSILSNEAKNRIFIGTDKGIKVYTLYNNFFRLEQVINEVDGLGGSRFNNLDMNSDNFLLHTTKEDLTILDKEFFERSITGKIELNKVFNKDSIYDYKTKFTIPREKNHLTIEGSFKSFDNPNNFKFYYSITKDNKKEQLKELTGFSLNLNEISPGDYLLKFYAFPLKDNSSKSEISFNFSVDYYLWETKWFVIVLIIIILIISYLIMYRIQKTHKQTLELKNQIKSLEVRSLGSQMSPHFIFNVLNNIQTAMILKGEKKANEYISSFSNVLRGTLAIQNSKTISLYDEIKYLKSYLELENIRMNESIKISFHIEINNSKLKEVYIPCMLFQPIIENSILHGLKPKKNGDKKISISFLLNNNFVTIEIKDNGIGRVKAQEDTVKGHKSWGTHIIKERINLFNSLNKKKDLKFIIFDLYQDGLPIGTKVEMNIPLSYNYH